MYKKITKENIGQYFADFSKEIKKEFGRKVSIDVVVVGGASILLNYSFRDSTTDVDGYFSSFSSLKGSIERVAEKNNLPPEWLNNDFTKTASFSNKLAQHSKLYKTYNQVLNVRTVQDEYLIAMKIMSGRDYKSDISDVIGVLQENNYKKNKLGWEQVEKAIIDLYDTTEKIKPEKLEYFKQICEVKNPKIFEELYQNVKNYETNNKSILVDFEKKYEHVLDGDNVEKILSYRQEESLDDIFYALEQIDNNKESPAQQQGLIKSAYEHTLEKLKDVLPDDETDNMHKDYDEPHF